MSVDVDRIRAYLTDPVALCSALGLMRERRDWKRQGRGVTVRCPWHDEKSPSCSVTVGTHGTIRASCFGCSASADALGLIAAVYRLDVRGDYRQVAELACQIAGLSLESVDAWPAPPAPRLPPEPERLDDVAFTAIAEVIAQRCPVDAEPEVGAYLRARALHGVGAPVLAALPVDARGLVAEIVATVGADAWQRSGLAAEHGGLLFPSHRLVAFWCGEGGTVQTIQRRLIRPERDKREPKYVFASRRQPRWPYGIEMAEALGPGGEVCFVEGALDALAMRAICARYGVDRLALGIPGVSAWSRAWAHLAAGRVAVVAMDADEAGERVVDQIAQDLCAAGAADVRIAWPDGAKDWAEALQREEMAA